METNQKNMVTLENGEKAYIFRQAIKLWVAMSADSTTPEVLTQAPTRKGVLSTLEIRNRLWGSFRIPPGTTRADIVG